MWLCAIDNDETDCVVTWKVEDATTLTCHSQSVPRGLYLSPGVEEEGRREGRREEGREEGRNGSYQGRMKGRRISGNREEGGGRK